MVSGLVGEFVSFSMNRSIRTLGSLIAIAGLIQQALNARDADPFSLSFGSTLITFCFAVMLFLVNLRTFKLIGLNIGKFDFDQHSLSTSMYLIKDRSRDILRLLEANKVPSPKH